MTGREVGGDAWDQGFDEEGRLETISDGSDTWSFTYDGDGIRVLQENPDGISGATQRATTLFLDGGSYEVHLSAGGEETLVRRYYGVAGQRVLLDGTDTYYLLTDHLGSVVAVADSEGDLASEQRYREAKRSIPQRAQQAEGQSRMGRDASRPGSRRRTSASPGSGTWRRWG